MDHISFRRRRLLLYLGLGIAGAGTTIGCSSNPRKENLGEAIAPANTPPVAANSTEIATLPPASQPLPEFQGITQWLNSDPLTVANLRGSVVLIQFWTFACINCQRTLPYIVQWHQQYAAKGLKVIGIHTPEFAFERDVNTIKQALQKHKITYPVPVDSSFKTWNAYRNEYWPHLFLADRQGRIRYDHIGEGAYDTTAQTIQKLLG
jgi:thiol-disulfide isomerase/thioredoxin